MKLSKENPAVPSASVGPDLSLGSHTKRGEGAMFPGFPRLRTAAMNPLPAYTSVSPLHALLAREALHTHSVDVRLPLKVMAES